MAGNAFKAAGTLTADASLARRYLAMGVSFVAVGLDTSLLAGAVRKLAGDFGKGVAVENSNPVY